MAYELTYPDKSSTTSFQVCEQLKPIMDKSPQGIYAYLDDVHKICNKKLADLLGYKSIREWADTDAPLSDIVEEDQETVVSALIDASEKR
ncbi:MAG: hypothetical protein HY529_03115 [Chloroflexi bacterium]|nr:hypothetical protein [Chloroflexota bacterium]